MSAVPAVAPPTGVAGPAATPRRWSASASVAAAAAGSTGTRMSRAVVPRSGRAGTNVQRRPPARIGPGVETSPGARCPRSLKRCFGPRSPRSRGDRRRVDRPADGRPRRGPHPGSRRYGRGWTRQSARRRAPSAVVVRQRLPTRLQRNPLRSPARALRISLVRSAGRPADGRPRRLLRSSTPARRPDGQQPTHRPWRPRLAAGRRLAPRRRLGRPLPGARKLLRQPLLPSGVGCRRERLRR